MLFLEYTEIMAANMWTRKDIKEFKESIYKEGKDSIIKVGHGETVTVIEYLAYLKSVIKC